MELLGVAGALTCTLAPLAGRLSNPDFQQILETLLVTPQAT